MHALELEVRLPQIACPAARHAQDCGQLPLVQLQQENRKQGAALQKAVDAAAGKLSGKRKGKDHSDKGKGNGKH